MTAFQGMPYLGRHLQCKCVSNVLFVLALYFYSIVAIYLQFQCTLGLVYIVLSWCINTTVAGCKLFKNKQIKCIILLFDLELRGLIEIWVFINTEICLWKLILKVFLC